MGEKCRLKTKWGTLFYQKNIYIIKGFKAPRRRRQPILLMLDFLFVFVM